METSRGIHGSDGTDRRTTLDGDRTTCPVSRRTARIRVLAVVAATAAASAGCSYPTAYYGTGLLNTSGEATLVAPQTVRIVSCDRTEATTRAADPSDWQRGPMTGSDQQAAMISKSYAVLALGDACRIEGTSFAGAFTPVSGNECTLTFAEGPRKLRVTSTLVRYGQTDRWRDPNALPNYVEVQVGGDDATTGRHLVYAFSGTAVTAPADSAPCAAAAEPRLAQSHPAQ
jgi:hypothetical protein